ncbi:retrovirus-related pol polyprotein from transposon TNT 1-94 [Tanacetum coccineum]
MIALDHQHVRAKIRHSLHHYWLLEGVLSGFNLGVLGVWVGTAPLVLLRTNGGRVSYPNVSGSQPKSNTRNNRIPRPSSRSEKNTVEFQPRKFNSISNKNNHVSNCNVTIVEIVLWYLDSICSKHMTGHRDKLIHFVSKFIGIVRFGNDHSVAIMGYGDLQFGSVLISRVYYVERLGHNIFSVGQLCFCGCNLYTISLNDMMKSSSICLLSKASKTKSWLWHRHLSHFNFGTINQLAKAGLVRGLPKLNYTKDHLCSACQMGKGKKECHKPKPKPSTNSKLQMSHMDLCRPMRVESINGKMYILVIVDDHSRFTWVKFLRTKDETPETIIKVLKQAQVSLQATIRYLRIDNV